MNVFVTVGSTGFNELIHQVSCEKFLKTVKELGYSSVLVQYGESESAFAPDRVPAVKVEGYKYKPDITVDMENADLIICHAGAGSILQALRLPKTKQRSVIVVSNPTLMDNHQQELANALMKGRYCVATRPSELVEAVQQVRQFSKREFPEPNLTAFAQVIDSHMGYS